MKTKPPTGSVIPYSKSPHSRSKTGLGYLNTVAPKPMESLCLGRPGAVRGKIHEEGHGQVLTTSGTKCRWEEGNM